MDTYYNAHANTAGTNAIVSSLNNPETYSYVDQMDAKGQTFGIFASFLTAAHGSEIGVSTGNNGQYLYGFTSINAAAPGVLALNIDTVINASGVGETYVTGTNPESSVPVPPSLLLLAPGLLGLGLLRKKTL